MDSFLLWNKSNCKSLYKADISIRRTEIFVLMVSTLDRINCVFLLTLFLHQVIAFSYQLSRDFPDSFPGKELFVRSPDEVDPHGLLEELLLKHCSHHNSNDPNDDNIIEGLEITAKDIQNEDFELEDTIEILIQFLQGEVFYCLSEEWNIYLSEKKTNF